MQIKLRSLFAAFFKQILLPVRFLRFSLQSWLLDVVKTKKVLNIWNTRFL